MTSSQAKTGDKSPVQFNLKGPKKFFDDLDSLQEELGVTSRTELIKLAVKELSENVRVRSEKVLKEVGLHSVSSEESREFKLWTADAFANSKRLALLVDDLTFLKSAPNAKLFRHRITAGLTTQIFIPHSERPNLPQSYLPEATGIINSTLKGLWDQVRAPNSGGLEILGYRTQPALTGCWTDTACAVAHRNGWGDTFCKLIFIYNRRTVSGSGYFEFTKTLNLVRQHCLQLANSNFLELAQPMPAVATKRPRKR
ncbi:ribbon-helix-helix domain-containing protein [Bradyrhizobium manausense]|uniref:ribbon-helix-helix domain-containing protein n=1 Tax=Bradyrhizobium manausense TaxID=989370 RepID=UPI001BACACFE|nr:ribbon-helix-helix domain-containing protein [Bradyrhizobium manausense]MBR0721752.1 hypothetical protein [Bradyrhizobium manausense]